MPEQQRGIGKRNKRRRSEEFMGMGESKKHPKGLGGTSLTKKFRMGREQGDKVLV